MACHLDPPPIAGKLLKTCPLPFARWMLRKWQKKFSANKRRREEPRWRPTRMGTRRHPRPRPSSSPKMLSLLLLAECSMCEMNVIFWNMAGCFCFKSVIFLSNTPKTSGLCWSSRISIWNLYQLLLKCVIFWKMNVILVVDVIPFKHPDLEELTPFQNEYKLEHFKLEY
jgi:hypothetical protein